MSSHARPRAPDEKAALGLMAVMQIEAAERRKERSEHDQVPTPADAAEG